MAQILVVCTGNICRSPVGAALLKECLDQKGLTDWSVTSAGTWAQVERGPSQFSMEIMAEQGLDIQDHLAEMIELSHMQEADLVLCMESGHVEALKAEFPDERDKVFLISEMADRRYNISDPYGKNKDSYYRMVQDLSGIIEDGIDTIIQKAGSQAAAR